MQARLAFVPIPSFVVALIFALVASLILGGVLGYTLKPPVTLPVRSQVVVVHDLTAPPGADACVWVTKSHKDC